MPFCHRRSFRGTSIPTNLLQESLSDYDNPLVIAERNRSLANLAARLSNSKPQDPNSRPWSGHSLVDGPVRGEVCAVFHEAVENRGNSRRRFFFVTPRVGSASHSISRGLRLHRSALIAVIPFGRKKSKSTPPNYEPRLLIEIARSRPVDLNHPCISHSVALPIQLRAQIAHSFRKAGCGDRSTKINNPQTPLECL